VAKEKGLGDRYDKKEGRENTIHNDESQRAQGGSTSSEECLLQKMRKDYERPSIFEWEDPKKREAQGLESPSTEDFYWQGMRAVKEGSRKGCGCRRQLWEKEKSSPVRGKNAVRDKCDGVRLRTPIGKKRRCRVFLSKPLLKSRFIPLVSKGGRRCGGRSPGTAR